MHNQISANYLAPSFFKKLEIVNPQNCFELFMGKKFEFGTKNDNDQLIYKFLLQAANQKSNTNKILKIKHFHPENLQKLLAIAHDLALQNKRPEKAFEFRNNLHEIQGAQKLPPLSTVDFSFKDHLENQNNNKSYITIIKVLVIGFLVFGFGSLAFGLQSSQVDFQGYPLKQNSLNPNPYESLTPNLCTKISPFSYPICFPDEYQENLDNFREILRNYYLTIRLTEGRGDIGQIYIDHAWNKLHDFVKEYPEFSEKLPKKKFIAYNDGTDGLATGIANFYRL